MKVINFPIKHEKVDDVMMPQKRARLPRNSRSEDTQIGDSSRMESPPSMEVEEP